MFTLRNANTQRMMVDTSKTEAVPVMEATSAAEGATARSASPAEAALTMERNGISQAKEGWSVRGAEAASKGSGKRGNLTAREVARQVYGESGMRGFYRGFGVSVLQFAPTSAVRARDRDRDISSCLCVVCSTMLLQVFMSTC